MAIAIEEILVENSTYQTGHLKRLLLKNALLINECALCGLGEEWEEKPITLVLDHINGINNDHRLSNLRILCPNCHSQTSSFAGRNIKWPDPVHGLLSTYTNHGCKCDLCKGAERDYRRTKREKSRL